jgi:hypothetical protein
MPQDFERDFERGISPSTRALSSLISPHVVDGLLHGPRSGINQSPFEEYNFEDSSEPLFSMYSKIGEEEDNKMVERWQKDAEENFLFVSPLSPFMQTHLEQECNRRVYFLP